MPVDTRRPMRPGPFRPNMDEPLDGIVTSNVAFEALASAAAQSPLSSSFWADFLRSPESTAYPLSPAQNVPHGDVPLYPSGNGYSTDASHGWFYMSTMVDNVAPPGPSVSASPVPSAQVAPFISNANLSPLPLENQTFTTVGYELAASVPTSSGYQTYLEQSAAVDSLSEIQSFDSFQIDQFPADQTSNIASESWLPELVPDSFADNIDSFTLPLDSRRDQTVPSHGFVLEIQTDVSIPDPTSHPVPSPSVSQATRVQSISSETPSPSTALVPTKKRKREPLDQFKATPLQDSNGALIGTFATFGNIGGRQAYSSDDRRKTAKTRQVGACKSCKKAKKRCDRPDSPYECCKNCKSRVFVMPCFLAKIVDAQLFRDKPSPGHPQSIRREVYETLSDVAIRQAQPIRVGLTQDFGIQLEVSLAPYEPQPGEITSRVWKDSNGVKHTVDLPPYCIANMQEAQERLAEYIGDFRGAFIRSTLNRCNEITRRIFDQAQRVAAFNPDSMVSQALSLCAASRIIERDWRICSHPRTLPIPFISGNPENPFNDTYPVTAMMDSQLDQIVIKNFLTPIRDRLLAQLDVAMTSPSSQTDNNSWFEIFLTLAILLSHAEWLLDHSRRNAIRMGAKTRYNYIPRAEAYFHACRIMLAHWHHLCGGSTAPLRIGMGRLQGEEKEFVEGLGMLVERRKEEMRGLKVRHRYEEELYWCHQLFFEGWEVGRLGIVDVVE